MPKKALGEEVDISDGAVFYDDNNSLKEPVPKGASGRKSPDKLSLRDTPFLLPVSSFNQDFPQPSKAIRDRYSSSYLQRPLPDLPENESTDSSGNSSELSETPSLSTSLMGQLDHGSFEDDVVEVKVTNVVRYTKVTERPKGVELARECSASIEGVTESVSDYDTSVSSRKASQSVGMISPGSHLLGTGSLLEQHASSNLGPGPSTPRGSRRGACEDPEQASQTNSTRARFSLRSLRESEWMRRSPSPVRRGTPGFLSRKMWSPRPNRKSAKEYFAGLRNDNAASGGFSDSNLGSELGDENKRPEDEVKGRVGCRT